MHDIGVFLFLAAGSIGLFSYLSVAHWVEARKAERVATERFAVLRKLSEQPSESARLVLELLREEDQKTQQQVVKKERMTRRDGMQFGSVLIAIGLGLMMMFLIAAPRHRVWAVGLVPILVGVVVFGFAAFNRPGEPPGA